MAFIKLPPFSSSRRMAFVTFSVLKMWYLSKTARVLWPLIFIATRSGTSAFTRILTAGQRRS